MKTNHSDRQAEHADLAKRVIYFISSNYFRQAILFLFGVAMARYLGQRQFGEFILSVTFIALMEEVATGGLRQAAIKFTTRCEDNTTGSDFNGLVIVITAFGVSSAIAVLFNLFSNFLFRYFPDFGIESATRIMSLEIPFYCMTYIMLHILHGKIHVRYQIIVDNIIRPVARLLIVVTGMVLLPQFKYKIEFLSVGLTLLGILIFIIVCLIYGKKIGFRASGILDREAYLAVSRFSFPIFLLALPNVVHGRSPQIIYPYFGGTPALLAIFIAASRVSSALNGFFAGLNANMIKEVARVPESNRKDSEDLYKKITRWGGYVMLPTATVMIIGAPQIMGLFGAGFTDGAPVLIILLIGEILNGMLGPSGNLLNMRGHGRVSFKISLLMLVVYLIPSPIIINYYGLLGFAAWLSVIRAFWAFLLSFSVKRIFGFWPFTSQFFTLFLGTALLTFGFTLTPHDLTLFPPPALITISTIVLVGLTFFIAMTHEEDKHLIKKILKRLKIYAPS